MFLHAWMQAQETLQKRANAAKVLICWIAASVCVARSSASVYYCVIARPGNDARESQFTEQSGRELVSCPDPTHEGRGSGYASPISWTSGSAEAL